MSFKAIRGALGLAITLFSQGATSDSIAGANAACSLEGTISAVP